MISGTILVLLLPPIAVGLLVRGLRGHRSVLRFLAELGVAAYGLAVIALTLFPLPYQRELIESQRAGQFLENNFVPFATIGPALQAGLSSPTLRNVAGNLVLLAPIGFAVAALSTRPSLVRAISVVVLVAVGIELAQLAVSAVLGYTYKITDIDDVLLNVTGGLTGYAAGRLARRALFADLIQERPGRTPANLPPAS